jgi:hypothetical protein
VSRKIFQLAGTAILILATLTPLMECFDRWDNNSGPANDTEIRLTAWFVGIGVVLTLAKILRRIPPLAIHRATINRSFHFQPTAQNERPIPTASPPLISLRI